MPSELCPFDSCVLLVTYSLKSYFLLSLMQVHRFVFLLKTVLLAHSALHCSEEKEHASLTKCLPSWIGEGQTPFPDDFERPLLAPRRDFLMLIHKATMTQNALWSEHMQAFSFAYPPRLLYQHRLNSLIIRDPMESDSLTLVLPVCEPLWTWQ